MDRTVLLAAVMVAGVMAGPGAQPPPASGQAPSPPVFSARAELVVLHVTVRDRRGAYVGDLPADAFTVLEDDVPQRIEMFLAQDAPVTVGLLVDNSTSMMPATAHILAAAGAFVRTSHPQDEIFALAFNDRVRAALPPEAPFTSDAATLDAALRGVIAPWGRTALHDAILTGLRYADRGTYPRKVLVVVGDGGDNASATSFDDVLPHVLASNAAIYTIAIVDPLDRDANPRRLRRLAELTGGEAFSPGRIGDVGGVIEQIARDIRHTYTIGFVPATSARDGEIRRIQVAARAPDRRGLSVRTRQQYAVEEGVVGHGR